MFNKLNQIRDYKKQLNKIKDCRKKMEEIESKYNQSGDVLLDKDFWNLDDEEELDDYNLYMYYANLIHVYSYSISIS